MSSNYGSPDWQRYAAWIGRPLAEGVNVTASPGNPVAPPLVQVASWRSIQVQVVNGADYLTVQYSPTWTGSSQAGYSTPTVVIGPNGVACFRLPVIGDEAEFSFLAYAGSTTFSYMILPSNQEPGWDLATDPTSLYEANGNVIAAGAQGIYDIAPYGGDAIINIACQSSGNFWGEILTWDGSGLNVSQTELPAPVAWSGTTGGVIHQRIALPSKHNQVRIQNTDTASHSYDICVARPV